MKANLSSNKELDNYKEQDTFNFITKADAIKSFLEFSLESLKDNKMIVLYGEWGSGKSSLMKHIEFEINKDIYYPIFFKAWEHEKDDNLALSLCDAITNTLDKHNEVIKDFMKAAFATLKCFASGITIKAPSFLTGLGLDAEFSGEKYIKAIDESLKDKEPISFYKTLEDFKVKFQKIEKLILGNKAQKLLIFIDDLDRCEPENVLNLITAIKLFFTYGEDSVYFCGLDKTAVKMAVKTKYKDEVKAEEYLEKVFDISFNMPKTYEISRMLKNHFLKPTKNFSYYDKDKNQQKTSLEITELIEKFFRAIRFTNPRHLKKVLNKYTILTAYKEIKTNNQDNNFNDFLPDLHTINKDGKLFETIYALFMIVLFEFDLDTFKELQDYNSKFIKLKTNDLQNRSANNNFTGNDITRSFIDNFDEIKIYELFLINPEYLKLENTSSFTYSFRTNFTKFILIFSTSQIKNYLTSEFIDDRVSYEKYFPDDNISTRFCRFLINYSGEIVEEGRTSDYKISNLFKMVDYLL